MEKKKTNSGAIYIWIVLGIGTLVAFFFWAMTQLGAPPPPVTTDAYKGNMTTPTTFPATLDKGNTPFTVVYTIQTRKETRAAGAGTAATPLTATPWVGASGETVTFTLTGPNAVLAGGAFLTKQVNTDGQGNASIKIDKAATGPDVLTFTITAGGKTFTDSVAPRFEVDNTP